MRETTTDILSTNYRFDVTAHCWLPSGLEDFPYSDGAEVEQHLFRIILKASDRSTLSTELARHITDWPSRYHLSPLRANLLRPMAHLLTGRILEIGAGCGAITRYLGECGAEVTALEGSLDRARIAAARCAGLENVNVVADALHRFPVRQDYDVVTLIGVLEYARRYHPRDNGDPVDSMLQHASAFLKPGGILIVAIENQLGLKYFAGSGEDHIGVSMFGLEDRYSDSGPVTFGRHELKNRLSRVGLFDQQWWFPFPDYKLPKVVASERGLEPIWAVQLNELICSALESDPQLPRDPNFSISRAWSVVSRNGLGSDLANSFLVMASATTHAVAQVDIAFHFSAERVSEYAKITSFQVKEGALLEVERTAMCPDRFGKKPLPLRISLDESPEFIDGILWSRQLSNMLSSEGWSLGDITAWAERWVTAVLGEIDKAGGNSILVSSDLPVPGHLLDAVPRNMVVNENGEAKFIDLEWKIEFPIDLGFLLFRGVFLSLMAVKHVENPELGTPLHGVTMFLIICRDLGVSLSQDDIDRFCVMESKVQAWVSNCLPLHIEDIYSYHLRPRQLNAVAQREAEIAQREAEIAQREAEIARRDAEIHWLKQSLSSKSQQLEAVYKSFSWRITALPRFALRTMHYRGLNPNDRQHLGRVFRRAWSSVMRFGQARKVSDGLPMPSRHGLSEQASGLDDILVWGVIDWHFRIQRPQHLARELAATGRRVFYFTSSFVGTNQPGFFVERLDESGRLYQVALHLPHRTSIYALPPSHDELRQLAKGLGLFLEWSGSQRVINLIQHAFWLDVAAKLPNSRLVYDCMDHHEGFGGVPEAMIALERRLAERADLVVVSSQWLDEVITNINPKRVIVRNACQYDHFCQTPSQRFQDTAGRQIIGYYGAIAEWFDLELVAAVAEKHPNCLILLVGADTCGAQAVLSKHANVQFTGEVPYAALPGYLYAFDVCMLPFHVVPLTLATNPVKLYEYLSAGKPVVAVDLPEMRQFGDLIRVAGSHSEFVAHIGMGLSAPFDEEEVKRRQRFAAEQTWAHRARQMVEAIQALPEPKVSVVVVTYNNLELTKACLHSLEQHSLYSNLEIIVVDNASADESPAFLRDWVAGGEGRHLILNADNKGFAAANNQGLALAAGDYLVLLNNDTVVTPGWVRTLLNHLRQDPSIGIIGPVTNNIGNEARIEIQYDTMDSMQAAAAAYTREHLGEVFSIRTLAFFCVMLPRSTYDKVGPLDEAFGRGFFEDDDYCRRVEQLGLRSVCAEDVFVHHHLSASFSKLKDDERKILFERNKAVYESKWGRWIPHSYRAVESTVRKVPETIEPKPKVFEEWDFLNGTCNVCGEESRFFYNDPRLWREQLVCEHCRTTARYRSIANGVLRALTETKGVSSVSLSQLPNSLEGATFEVYDTQPPFNYEPCAYPLPDVLKLRPWIQVSVSQYKSDLPLGMPLSNGASNQNLECLTFPDNSFDLVITSDVMEHVRLDECAHREIYRVLKPGGRYIFTVPHDRGLDQTLVRVKVTDPDDPAKDEHLLDPKYHGDTNNPEANGVLSYRVYGRDLDEFLTSLGFEVEYGKEDQSQSCILNAELYYCRKTGAHVA